LIVIRSMFPQLSHGSAPCRLLYEPLTNLVIFFMTTLLSVNLFFYETLTNQLLDTAIAERPLVPE